jgi:glycosyltransferase involved in cell wall biosynthesis
MTEKLVSVIIPAFNAERFIDQALDSVSTQTYQNWEILVTNDRSADGTSRIVSEFAQKTSQPVRVLEHEQNAGLSASRNTAMQAARGDYIAFLDADDFWLPDHLKSVCALLTSGSVDLAYAECFVFRDTASGEIELIPTSTIAVKNPPVDLFRRNFINPSGAAITRQLMEKVGGFGPRRVEDLDYWIRAAALGFRIGGTGEKTYYYRKSGGGLSAAFAEDAEGLGGIFEKHRHCGILPEKEILARARETYLAAGKLYWRKNPAAASRMFYKAWTLGRAHLQVLFYAFLAAGLGLTRTGVKRA